MRRLITLMVLALALPRVYAQVLPITGITTNAIQTLKVSQLPTGRRVGTVYVVTDGASSSDCATGSGSTAVACLWSGSSWTALGGSGGSGTVTSSGSPSASNIAKFTTSTNIAPAAATDIVALWGSGSCSGYLKSDGTCSTPATTWNNIGNPTGVLNLTMGANASLFSYGTSNATPGTFAWYGAFAATSILSQNSPVLEAEGNCWTGSASAADGWLWQNVVGNGAGGGSTLTFTHSYSGGTCTGPIAVQFPAGVAIGSADTGAPAFTFAANSITANQPVTLPNSSVLGTPASITLTNATFPTLNQNTTGTAANLSGTPALPNGTTATTQTALDSSTKLATTAYADTAVTNLTNILCNPLNTAVECLDEEFLGAGTATNQIGALGWSLTNVVSGTAAVSASIAQAWPWVGSVRVSSAAVSGDGGNISLPAMVATSNTTGLFTQGPWDSYFIFKFGVSSGASYRIGYMTNNNAIVTPKDGAYLRFDPNLTDITAAIYTSGGTFTGTVNQTCNATFTGGTATATLALTGTNTVAGSTAFIITSMGTGYSTVNPTTVAVLSNGTATCSGTAVVSVTNGAAASGADTTLHVCTSTLSSYLEQCVDTAVSPDTSQHLLRIHGAVAGTVGLTLDAGSENTFCSGGGCTVTMTPSTSNTLTPVFQVVSLTTTTAEVLYCKSWRFKATGLTF